MPFIDVDKSCQKRNFFNVASLSFNAVRENKNLAKISEFTVYTDFDSRKTFCFL